MSSLTGASTAQTADVQKTYQNMNDACLPVMEETATNGAQVNAQVTPEIKACINAMATYNHAAIYSAQEVIKSIQENPDLPQADRDAFAHHYANLINGYCADKLNTFNQNAANMSLPEKGYNLNNLVYICQTYAVGPLSSHVEQMVENQPNSAELAAELYQNGLTPESYVYSAMGAAFCVSAAFGDLISGEIRQGDDSAYTDELARCVDAMNYSFKP